MRAPSSYQSFLFCHLLWPACYTHGSDKLSSSHIHTAQFHSHFPNDGTSYRLFSAPNETSISHSRIPFAIRKAREKWNSYLFGWRLLLPNVVYLQPKQIRWAFCKFVAVAISLGCGSYDGWYGCDGISGWMYSQTKSQTELSVMLHVFRTTFTQWAFWLRQRAEHVRCVIPFNEHISRWYLILCKASFRLRFS